MAVVIVLNFVVVIVDTDCGAKDEESPQWMNVATWFVLVSFVVELGARFFVLRSDYIKDRWNVFDTIVIGTDFTMSIIGIFRSKMIDVSGLRILRLTRLARATKIVKVFPELRLMLAGLIGALNAIFWGTVLLFTTLLIWSVIAVQFIHPLNKEIADRVYDLADCPRCFRAYESTFQAALTFCTQIVAGDSWGRETVPIIENYPATALFFAGVYLSVGLALLNLILGVVVNVATEERERLIQEMAAEKDLKRLDAQDKLHEMCRAMDEDGNDELTMNEIKHGYEHNEAFRDTLDKMDIGREDLDIVWTILDSDKSGTITSKEFVTQVYQLKSSDTQFILAYIKYYITEIKDKLRDDLRKLQLSVSSKFDQESHELGSHLDKLEEVNRAAVSQGDNAKKMVDNSTDLSLAKLEMKDRPVDAYTVGRVGLSSSDRVDSPLQLDSLKMLFEQTQILKAEAALATSPSSAVAEHTATLVQLQSIWQQCLVSISDLGKHHTNLTALLASQAKYLTALIRRMNGSAKSGGLALAEPEFPLSTFGGQRRPTAPHEAKACWLCGHRTETEI
jgi:hypothetical protein